jgi:hypothetical protein
MVSSIQTRGITISSPRAYPIVSGINVRCNTFLRKNGGQLDGYALIALLSFE